MLDAAVIRSGSAAQHPCAADDGSARVRTVDIFTDFAAASGDWTALERVAPISPYQTARWLRAWLDTKGQSLGVTPAILVARDAANLPLAILPFGLRRKGILTVGGFLGGRDSNINLGLFRPGPVWERPALLDLLRRGARRSGSAIDLFVLRNQPFEWDGRPNPMAVLPHQPSPSFVHKVGLAADPDAFFRTLLSKDTRKKLRRKSERLQALGPLELRRAVTDAERGACLDAFILQRTSRNIALGLGTADLPEIRRFLDRACDPQGGLPAVEAQAFYCGERIVATFFGASDRDRFCGMSMSFDADPDLARSSPGELMLAALLESKCRDGLAFFDLGIGEARYKDTYCPLPEPLFDTLIPVSARGRILAEAERLRLLAKRRVKQSPWAWDLVQALRRTRSSLTPFGTGPGRA